MTGPRRADLSHEQFTRSEQVEGTCPKNSNWFKFLGLVALRDLSFDPSEAKLASSHDGTSPLDLLKGLDAGTSPLVCSDL